MKNGKMDRRSFFASTAASLVLFKTGGAFATELRPRLRNRNNYLSQLLNVRELESQGLAPKGVLRFGLTPNQIPDAYELQDQMIDALTSNANRLVGWKIGFSTVSGRTPLGITEPAYGPLFSSGLVQGDNIRTSSFAGLLVEQELVLTVDQDIDQRLSLRELQKAVRSVRLGFELPSKRFQGAPGAPDGPTAADMIVDCLASHSYKLGPALPVGLSNSTTLNMVTTRDGAAFATGTTGMLDDGRAGLGPLKAMDWLIEKLLLRRARLGGSPNSPVLKAGEIVYTGAIPGPKAFLANGQTQAHFHAKADSAQADLTVIVK